MLGHDALNTGVPGDVADEDRLVIQQKLTHALVGPSIEEVLEPRVLRPVIWEVDQEGLLDVVLQVAAFTNLCKAVVEGPRLGDVPEGVDKVVGISLNVEIMPTQVILELRLEGFPTVGYLSLGGAHMSM